MLNSRSCREGDWIAVLVRTNYERVVATQLSRHGYEQFLPLYRPRGALGNERARLPLFPGYLFCRYAKDNPHRIIQVNGVIRLLGVNNAPLAVPEAEVEAVRRIVELGVPAEPASLRVGQRVRVIAGPLAGLEGVLLATRERLRVIVSVTMLQRAVAAEVKAEQLELLPDLCRQGAELRRAIAV